MRLFAFGLTSLCLLALAAPATAAPKDVERRAEAKVQVHQILAGQAIGGGVARLQFLREEGWAVGVFGRALQDGLSEAQRRYVAQALALLEHRSAEKHLLTFLDDPDAAVRMAGAEGLGRLRSSASKDVLPLVSDPSFGVRREAARALLRMGTKGMGKQLLTVAASEGEPEIRVALLDAAAVSRDKGLVPPLVRFAESSSEVTRFAALRALCRFGAKEGLEEARRLVTSLEPGARAQGIALLEGAPLKSSAPLLEPLLSSGDAKLAAAAARTLFESGDRRMLAWLVVSSAQSQGEEKLAFERELERLKVTDVQRREVLRTHAGRTR